MKLIPWRISVRAIYQTTLINCGPASAQMVLHTIRAKPPSQGVLLTEIKRAQKKDKRRKIPWASSPDGLTTVLNRYRPRGFSGRFHLYASTDKNKYLKELILTLSKYRVPSIVLIDSGAHWIVLYGYKNKGADPKQISEIQLANFDGFYFRDPLQKVSSEGYQPCNVWATNSLESVNGGSWNNDYVLICDPDPKKKYGVNKLQHSLKTGIQKKDLKIADTRELPYLLEKPDSQKISDAQKLQDALKKTKVQKNAAEEKNAAAQKLEDVQKKLAAQKEAEAEKKAAEDKNATAQKNAAAQKKVAAEKNTAETVPDQKKTQVNKKMAKTTKKSDQAKTKLVPGIVLPAKMPAVQLTTIPGIAKKVMDEKSARKISVWRLKHDGFYNPESVHLIMKTPIAGQPQLVKDLKNRSYYYCVPLKENGKIYANITLSATHAELWECLFAIRRNLPLEFAQLTKKIISLIKKYDASIKVTSHMIQPVMVWKRCKESTSMFLPFYKVKTKGVPLYVRMDGEVFRRLTDEY